MKARAVDFLTKPVRDQTLLDAGAAAIWRDVKQRTQAQVMKRNLGKLARLTPRERQLLRQVAAGRRERDQAANAWCEDMLYYRAIAPHTSDAI